MESSPAKSQNMIDTTDALEAVSSCQTMKNFLFMLIFIGLMLCQIVFWMNHFDLVGPKDCSDCSVEAGAVCPGQCSVQTEPQANAQNGDGAGVVYLAATTDQTEQNEKIKSIEQTVDQVVESSSQASVGDHELLEKDMPVDIPTEHATPEMLEPQDAAEETESQEKTKLIDTLSLFRISCRCATILVKACNYVILIAAVLYSLSLLICLKISLTGRLGGISHITKAFFLSLFLLVVLIPWQTVLPGVLVGALWQPSALCGWAQAETSTFWKILFYGRFCGLWFVAIWLAMWAQSRSAKWARATLRRLGVAR